MTEPDVAAASAATAPVTAGAMLRAAREAQGLHIAALATAIKVTPRKVDALENDRLHELPDTTFARALAQTICRYLKIDPQPVLGLLPASGTVALEPASRIRSTPYRDRGGRAEQGPARSLGPLFWGAAVLLLGALAMYLLPSAWLGMGSTVSQEPARPAAASAPLRVEPAASVALAAASAVPVPQSAASPVISGEAASAVTIPLAAAAVSDDRNRSVSAETVFSVPPSSSGATPAVGGALVVTTTDASWVEVRDAKGQLLLSETVQPGRSVGLNGPLPMRLLIGNASATQLVFMGRPVDVMARARENVARFELQ